MILLLLSDVSESPTSKCTIDEIGQKADSSTEQCFGSLIGNGGIFLIGTAKDASGGQVMNCYCVQFDINIYPLESQCCNPQFFSRVPSRCRVCFVSQRQIE